MLRIKELDGLRALAILMVLCCHYQGIPSIFGGIFQFGWLGVDIFFVLSGYLITTILLGLRDRSTPYKTFYSRRIIRIFPPYFATILAIVLISMAVHEHGNLRFSLLRSQVLFLQALQPKPLPFFKTVFLHPRWTFTHLPNLMHLAHQLPFGFTVGVPPKMYAVTSPYWSLSVEEYFYLLWAPIVLTFSRRSIVRIGIAICLVEMLFRWIIGDWQSYRSLYCRFDALLIGAFLAMAFERWRMGQLPSLSPKLFLRLFIASSVALAAILFAIRPVIGHEVRDSPLFMVFGLPAVSIATASLMGLLIFQANTQSWLARLLRTRVLQAIGTVSYTMYLVHLLAACLVVSLLDRFGWHLSTPGLVAEAALSAVVTFLIARLSWHLMEKPLLRWKDRRFPNAPHPPEPSLN